MKLTELMFEKFAAPALFVAPSPMLAAFSAGRPTALVVDVGASGCRATPVVQGLLLQTAQRRNGRGGDWLSNCCWKALTEQKAVLRPRYQLQGKTVRANAPSSKGLFHRWAMHDLLYEFCSSEHVKVPYGWPVPTPFTSHQQHDDAMEVDDSAPPTPNNSDAAAAFFELPDGTLVDLTSNTGKDLCRVPELLLTDETPWEQFDNNNNILKQHHTLSNRPLHKLIRDSLSAVADTDVRKDLCSNILLTGGASVIPNLDKRLSWEINQIVSAAYKCRVTASKFAVERHAASWIGGSILSSLGSFQQLWLSQAEYEEYGATLAVQRFP
jgi:actin-related protein